MINTGGDLSNEQIGLCDSKDFEKITGRKYSFFEEYKDFEKEELYQPFSQHDITGNHGNIKIMQNNNFSKNKKITRARICRAWMWRLASIHILHYRKRLKANKE